jgi:transposase
MLAEKRRQYPEAFTREAIRLVTEQGDGVSAAARNLGSNAQRLGRWKGEFDTQGCVAFPGHGRMASEQEELPRGRGDNKRLRMERDRVQKALGFWASGSN